MGTLKEILWGKAIRTPVSKAKRHKIRQEQQRKCAKCGKSLKRGGQVHHIHSRPWDSSRGELKLLCTNCHRKETDKQRKKRERERKKMLLRF